MARKSRREPAPEGGMDMTPMIDIVFNLIIFFMIVSELSNVTVEQLQLPFADRAKNPKTDPGMQIDKVLQVNVMPQKGLIKVRGAGYTMEPSLIGTYPSLVDFLKIEAAGYEREAPEAPGQQPPSKMRVNIRADKEVPFKYVQHVFEACQQNGIYMTSIAATEDDPEKGN